MRVYFLKRSPLQAFFARSLWGIQGVQPLRRAKSAFLTSGGEARVIPDACGQDGRMRIDGME